MVSVLDFGAKGDGKTDDTRALQHAVQKGDGLLVFPRGDYLLTRPLLVPLDLHGRVAISGQGGTARLLMAGAGPALHLAGTHRKSALPAHFEQRVWERQRMPTVHGIEILGRHPQADGIRIDGVMQPTLVGVLVRHCRHAIHLTNRDRNVLIADCHLYDNSGVGLFLDRVNLHQINVTGNHISYCKQGGIKVAGSEVRNLQIAGNDIEYNFDLMAETSADLLLDCREGTVREGGITGNTIQAKQSPNGANIRFVGVGPDKTGAVGAFAIAGNLIGSQETSVHLRACRGVVVSGNCLYNGYRRSLWAEECEHLVFSNNSIDHNPDYPGASTDQLILHNCRNVNLNGLLLQHIRPATEPVEASLELTGCTNVNVTACQVIGARVRGVRVRGGSVVRVADSTIRPRTDDRSYRLAVEVDGKATHVLVVHNFLGKGADGALVLPREAGTAAGNIEV